MQNLLIMFLYQKWKVAKTWILAFAVGRRFPKPHSKFRLRSIYILHYTNYIAARYNYKYNYTTLYNTTLHWLHCIILQLQLQLQLLLQLQLPLHCTTLHYNCNYATLHYTRLHYTNYTTPQLHLQLQLQLHSNNYTTFSTV